MAGALCGLVVLAPGHKRYPEWMSYAVPVAVAVVSRDRDGLRHQELTDRSVSGHASALLRRYVTPPEQDGGMNENETPQQLTLLPSTKPSSNVPLQFRLDEATRRRGLQHVAELRRLLAARQAAKADDTEATVGSPSRRVSHAGATIATSLSGTSTPRVGASDRTASQC